MRSRALLILCFVLSGLLLVPGTASADHTDPREPLSETADPGATTLLTQGEGEWEHIRHFPPNPGTDIKIFRKKGRLWFAAGTLGQGDEQHVGQRIIRLVDKKGRVRPRWVADHGSAHCFTQNPAGTTGLQHDQALMPRGNPKIMLDTTDATGRCHDPGGGGLEIVDVSKVHRGDFDPREIHLTRHAGTSHTVTVDKKREWIAYNNSSDSAGRPWIDVVNFKSCLRNKYETLAQKRKGCRPEVHRIHLNDKWTRRIDADGNRVPGTESACHDITPRNYRLYCANLNSTIVINVKNLLDEKGNVRGKPLKCEVIDGTNTAAKVTDCSNQEETGPGTARGWKYVAHFNHPGRNNPAGNNDEYTVREGIAVAHEAEPTPDRKWVFVTDERGGGVYPAAASCGPGFENPYGNGGVHVFRLNGRGEMKYAKDTEGNKAVFIGEGVIPAPTFCTSHVMEQIKHENRFMIAWYTQGTKIVDYFIDENNRWSFREIASVIPQNPTATTWTSHVFKSKQNKDGTITYWILASDISRGIDIMKWTGPANPRGSGPPPSEQNPQRSSQGTSAAALLTFGIAPALLHLSRRRRRIG